MIKRRQRFHSTGSLPNLLSSSSSSLSALVVPTKLRRSTSCEPQFRFIKPIMKAKTLDESLGSIGQTRKMSVGSEDSSSERNIQFHEIQIREYARTIGDNPSCSSGPPIAIAWEYDPNPTTMKLDEYEQWRPRRRSQMEMVIPRHERFRMLREEWEVPSSVIAASVRNAVKVKHQRRVTVSNLHADKWEEMVERASRKVTRTLFFRKSTSERARELEEQVEAANRVRSKWLLQMLEQEKDQLKDLETPETDELGRNLLNSDLPPIIAVEPEDDDDENDNEVHEVNARDDEAVFSPADGDDGNPVDDCDKEIKSNGVDGDDNSPLEDETETFASQTDEDEGPESPPRECVKSEQLIMVEPVGE